MKNIIKITIYSIATLGILIYFYWVLPVWGMPFNTQRHTQLPLSLAWVLENWLWKRTQEKLEVIRKFSGLHTEMAPYMYHYVVTTHNGGKQLQTVLPKGKCHYMFGDYFLVAPILKDSNKKKVVLSEGQWRYFFKDYYLIDGNKLLELEFPMDEYPVFIEEGAIIPLDVKRKYTNLGDSTSNGFTTILIYPKKSNVFEYFHTDAKAQTTIQYKLLKNTLTVSLKKDTIPHILRIHSDKKPTKITLDNASLNEYPHWSYDSVAHKTIIKTLTYDKGSYTIFL